MLWSRGRMPTCEASQRALQSFQLLLSSLHACIQIVPLSLQVFPFLRCFDDIEGLGTRFAILVVRAWAREHAV